MADLFAPAKPTALGHNWTTFLVGLVAMIIVVAAIKVISRDKNQAVAQASPYAARL